MIDLVAVTSRGYFTRDTVIIRTEHTYLCIDPPIVDSADALAPVIVDVESLAPILKIK